jgi:hypothetical protein
MANDFSKQIRKITRQLVKDGWTPVDKTNGTMYLAPGGHGSIMVHRSVSDRRALDNMKAEIRRIQRATATETAEGDQPSA